MQTGPSLHTGFPFCSQADYDLKNISGHTTLRPPFEQEIPTYGVLSMQVKGPINTYNLTKILLFTNIYYLLTFCHSLMKDIAFFPVSISWMGLINSVREGGKKEQVMGTC